MEVGMHRVGSCRKRSSCCPFLSRRGAFGASSSSIPSSWFVVACLLIASGANGTTMLRLSLEELVDSSAVVAQVHVVSTEVVEGDGRLETRATLRIDRALRGAPRGSILVVAIPGGVVEGWGQRVVGAPEVAAGDSALVFLEKAGGGRFRFVGMEQGFWKIVEGDGGFDVVRGQEARHVVRGSDGNIVEAPARPDREPLLPLLERVRLLVERGEQGP